VNITSVGFFCKNSTEFGGIVNTSVGDAPTEVEILTATDPTVSLHIRTQVAELRLVAVPVVVGVEI
jgi:hypothetical protein